MSPARGPYFYQLSPREEKRPKITPLAAQVMLNENRRNRKERESLQRVRRFIGLCPRCKRDSHPGKCIGASANPELRAKIYRVPRLTEGNAAWRALEKRT